MELISTIFPCCKWLAWLQNKNQENQTNSAENRQNNDCDDDEEEDDDYDPETNHESNGLELDDISGAAKVENCSSSDSLTNGNSINPSKVVGNDSLESTLLDSNSGNST